MTGMRQLGAHTATYVPLVLRRVSWTAVGAGVGVALLLHLLLSIYGHLHRLLMGVGVGMGTIDPTRLKTLIMADLSGIPGLCWQSLGLIALLIGSGVASRMAAASYRHEGMLHGLLTWGVVMLCLSFFPTTVFGNVMSGPLGALVATAHIAAQTSFGMMPAPVVGALVAVVGGIIGTFRQS